MSSPARQIRWFAAARELSRDEVPHLLAPPTFLWRQPSTRVAATVWGEAALVEGDPQRDPNGLRGVAAYAVEWKTARPPGPGPWWGGFAFDARTAHEGAWRAFGAARWILPTLALIETEERRHLVATGPSSAEPLRMLEAAVRRRTADDEVAERRPPRLLQVDESRAAWTTLVEQAQATFVTGAVSKVVAARRIDVSLDRPAEALELVDALGALHPGCATFAVSAGDALFAGATPETLVRIEGGRVKVDALAGTVPPGTPPGDKELREHRFVVDAVIDAIRPLTQDLEVAPEPALLPLRNLLHLKTPVTATVRPNVGLDALVAALHPTPAVCGTPRDAAREWIRTHEGFDRGWYAGAVGWVDDHDAHLCVALRCGLFDGARAQLFVGAGLVPGSTPDAEWDETTRKASAVIDALGGRP